MVRENLEGDLVERSITFKQASQVCHYVTLAARHHPVARCSAPLSLTKLWPKPVLS